MAMFRTTVINPLIKGKPVFNARRHFTVTSIHDSFPATLYRFQIHRDSRLYDKELKKGNEDLEFADGVEVGERDRLGEGDGDADGWNRDGADAGGGGTCIC